MMESYNAVLTDLLWESHMYGAITPRLADVIQHIAKVVIDKKYPNYHYKEDMISECMVWFVRCWTHCNLERTNNPFSYFYTGFYSCGLQVLSREGRERTVRENLSITTTTNDEEAP